MKALSLLLTTAIYSCKTAPAAGKLLAKDVQLELFIGLETRLDHSEMNRIFSSANHSHLKADKEALLKNAKAHVAPCLDLFRSSIEEHNNEGNGGGGGQLELVPFAKDGSRFHLTGTVKDFVTYLEKQEEGFFISFDETSNNKGGQVEIFAKYEDGRSAKNLPRTLDECTGFVGNFRRRQVESGVNVERKLKSSDGKSKSKDFVGNCLSSNSYFERYLEEYKSNIEVDGIPLARAETIRNIYGVPTLDGTCYNPRDSAIFEFGQLIDVEDVACYNQFNGLQETPIEAPEGSVEVNGICQNPDCSCPASNTVAIANGDFYSDGGGTCAEAILDVQMLAAVSGGTKIKSFSYFADVGNEQFIATPESFQELIQRKQSRDNFHNNVTRIKNYFQKILIMLCNFHRCHRRIDPSRGAR